MFSLSRKKILSSVVAPIVAVAAFGVLLSGCGNSATPAPEVKPLNVVATSTMLTDLATQIGGEKVKVTGLIKPGVDPHLFQASAGDVDTLSKADVVIYNGVHLEGKMEPIFENLAKQNKTLVKASAGIPESELLDFEEDGEVVKDPHIWFSLKNWKSAAHEVAKELAKKDPKNKDYYEANEKKYVAELDALDKEIKDKIAQVPEKSRVLVTAHDAFSYFARDYKFEIKSVQGVSTESEASTADISELANFIADHKLKAIFVESSVPVKTIQAVQEAVKAKGFDVTVGGELFSDSLGEAGSPAGTFIGMYRQNIDTIINALK